MPRIATATLAEHQAERRAAILTAARDLLTNGGADAVTPAAVGAMTGLARSSVYQYVDSSAALLALVVVDSFPVATAQMTAALATAGDPPTRLGAYVTTALQIAADPVHRALVDLPSDRLPKECREAIRDMHLAEIPPLVALLAELGAPNPALAARMVSGMVMAASVAVTAGTPLPEVATELVRVLLMGVGAPSV